MLKPLRMDDYIRNGQWLEFSASTLKDQAAAAGQEIQPLQAAAIRIMCGSGCWLLLFFRING